MDSSTTKCYVVCVCVLWLSSAWCTAAPLPDRHHLAWMTISRSGEVETGRIFWSALGDVLESLPFLPFTVNVPDALGAMWSYVSGWLPGGGGTADTGSRPGGNTGSRPGGDAGNKKKPKPKDAITGDDLVDYFVYDR